MISSRAITQHANKKAREAIGSEEKKEAVVTDMYGSKLIHD